MVRKQFYLGCIVVLSFLFSCSKPNNYSNINAEVVREWVLKVAAVNENHPTSGVVKSNDFHIKLFSDNSITFDILVTSLAAAGDGLKTIQINAGDPVTDGPLLLDLNPRISGAYASGIIKGIRQSLADTLLNNSIDKYVNVITTESPLGLLRGSLNQEIVFAQSVLLSGSEVVPSVSTTSNGMAYLRVTSDKKLYSKVTVNNAEAADPVTAATINMGAEGANGAVITTIASSPAEFDASKISVLSDSQFTQITHDNSYVNVISALNPSGKLRGQIR